MGGHPVQDDAEPGPVAAVDEGHELLRRSVARGGCEVAGDLISPGAVERMLHHGQEFQMRIAHVQGVGDQLIGDFRVSEGTPFFTAAGPAAVAALAPPGAEMNFIDVDRRGHRVPVLPLRHPSGVGPLVLRDIAQHGGRSGMMFHAGCVGVSLETPLPVLPQDSVFVCQERSGTKTRGGELRCPEAVIFADHGIGFAVPSVEFSRDADTLRVGRPNGKPPDVAALAVKTMRTRPFPRAEVPPCMERSPLACQRCRLSHVRTHFP